MSFQVGKTLLLFLIFIVLGISANFVFLIESSYRKVFFVHLLFAGAFMVFFRKDIAGAGVYAWVYLVGLFVFLLFLFLAWRKIQIEKKERIYMQFRKILTRGLPAFFTAFSIFVVLVYFFTSFSAGAKHPQELIVPRSVFDIAIRPLGGFIHREAPIYYEGMKADEFFFTFKLVQGLATPQGINVSRSLLEELQKKRYIEGESVDLWAILKDEETAVLIRREISDDMKDEQKREDIRAEYSERLGIVIDSEDTVEDVLYKLFSAQINNFHKSFSEIIPAAFAIALFFSLKALSWPLMWMIVLLTNIVSRILTMLKIIRVEKVEVGKEILLIN